MKLHGFVTNANYSMKKGVFLLFINGKTWSSTQLPVRVTCPWSCELSAFLYSPVSICAGCGLVVVLMYGTLWVWLVKLIFVIFMTFILMHIYDDIYCDVCCDACLLWRLLWHMSIVIFTVTLYRCMSERLVECPPLHRAIDSVYSVYLPKGSSPFLYLRSVSAVTASDCKTGKFCEHNFCIFLW